MSRLNYHHLYYFWRVATQGNLTQTAQALHVSQSALSAQIKKLEEVMDVTLFTREGRKLILTDEGYRVLAYANDIFSKGEELELLLQRGITADIKRFRIGILSTMSRNFIDAFIDPLLRNQKVHFSLHARGADNLLEGLAKHQFDLALSNIDVQGSDDQLWQSQLLARQAVAIVGPPGLKPAADFPNGYETMRWVLPTQKTQIRTAFDGYCTRWQFDPLIHGEADDMAMLRLLARDSGALAVVPKVVVRDEIRQGKLVSYMDLPNIYENFYAITIKRRYVPDILQSLLSEFEKSSIKR